jgi:uncharacterized membrane protein
MNTNKKEVSAIKKLKSFRKPLVNPNIAYRDKLSKTDRFAVFITERIGTVGFFLIIFFWTFLWLAWNIIAPKELKFDPFPGFVLWLFISNMIQILLMPLIMIGQNLQGRHSEMRAEEDFEINLKAEREVELIVEYLENQNKLLEKIVENNEKLNGPSDKQ